MEITSEHLRTAKAAGACDTRLSEYTIGQSVEECQQSDLAWIEQHLPDLARRVAAQICAESGLLICGVPALSVLARDGYGSGYGDGDGDGDGHGHGDGDGYGYGHGHGDGSGGST